MKKKIMTSTRVIMLGFLIGAFVGSLLLFLPISHKPGVSIEYIDSLFVATSAMCVTGLSTLNIGATFSVFGQIVLLLLIQLGGLGLVTFFSVFMIVFKRKVSLEESLLIQNAYNVDTLSGLSKLTVRILKAAGLVELVGAIGYLFIFVPEYGPVGIWYSVFHSVSAFCNAGIDLLGGNSLCVYRDNVWMNINTMFLIIAGGIGFPVYWEIWNWIKSKTGKKQYFYRISYHAKLVFAVTAALIFGGMLITLLFEYNNPDTIGNLPFGNKLLASLFQSVTLRTAGFASIDQGAFRGSSCLIYFVIMFIGGSPAGTAGGVKTITVLVLMASVISNIRGKKDVTIMKRRITDETVRRCVAIIIFSFSMLFILSGLLLAVQKCDFLDMLYEMTSAIATVGLSRGLTGELNVMGKVIVAIAMFLGRIGPITLGLAFNSGSTTSSATCAEGKIVIG